MDQDEQALFWAEMEGVTPLTANDQVVTFQCEPISAAQLARQAAAQAVEEEALLMAVDVVPLAPEDVLGWMRGGMQHGVYKNLRLGKYSLDARLDLHGLSVAQSRVALLQFIQDCQRSNIRSALILHGKGLHSQPFRGLLKSYVAVWLPRLPEVLAFHSALPQHGGTGAVYLLLKKSTAEKVANRERHQKR